MKDYSKPTFKLDTQNLSSAIVTIYGDMFQYVTLNGLYLSSSNTTIPTSSLNLYSHIKSISGRYPAVDVFPVYEYDVLNGGTILQFKMPDNLPKGNYDILYFNGAGYKKASDIKKFTYFSISSGFECCGCSTITYTPSSNVTFNLSLTADTDLDGYTDIIELSAGTDPNDPESFPVSLFNVFNNI